MRAAQVKEILFDPPRQPLPDAQLFSLLPIRAGEPLATADIPIALQRLYATGEYTDIALDAAPVDGGVRLTFITRLAYFVGRVVVYGAAEPPSAGQLEAATKLQLGTHFAEQNVRQAKENIEDSLRRNGLYRALVSYREIPHVETHQMDVEFSIHAGQRAHFDGARILGGGGALTPAQVIRAAGWHRPFGIPGWKELTESRLDDGVDAVRTSYQKHDHLLARVTLSGLEYHDKSNTVTPSLTIDPGPPVSVRVTGARVSKGQLRKLIPIYEERSIDNDLLMEGRRNLEEYLQAQGYFDAETNFRTSNESGGEMITYQVSRGLRHKLTHLEIAGNKYFTASTLRQRMYIMPATFLRFHHGRYGHDYLERDLDSIRELYRSNGFRDVRVTARTDDNYRGKSGHLAVFIQIDEGGQWLVGSLNLDGVPEGDRAQVRSIVRSAPGQPFSDYGVGSDRDQVLDYYFNKGYPDASFDFETTAGGPDRMNLTYIVHPGERRFVRGVLVSGYRETRPEVVNRQISVHTGEPLSLVNISDSQRRLYDLGIFARVQTAQQNAQTAEASKYVLFDVEEAHRYSLNVGFGAEIARIGGGTTDLSAPAGATGFSPEITLGISRLNLFGRDHTVSLQTRASTIEQLALLTYIVPQFRGHPSLDLQFSTLYDYSRDVRTFTARREEASVQLSERLTRALTLQYRLIYRDSAIIGTPLVSPELIPLLSQPVRVGIVSFGVIHDRRDNPTDPHRGIYTTLDLGLASSVFGSQTDYGRIIVRNASYHPLTKTLVLARSTYFGDIGRYGGADIPLAERFFSGGSTTDRGFPDNQAGPRDLQTGFPIGGTALLFETEELRFPLIGDDIGGVFFHDMGNVYSSLSELSLRYHQRGLQDFNYAVQTGGFGIRYRTPIGPLRFDFAYSPNSPRFFGYQGTYDQLIFGTGQKVQQRINPFQFQFSLGQAF